MLFCVCLSPVIFYFQYTEPKKDEITGEWRRLHNEELYDLYSSSGINRVIKSRIRWSGCVTRMGERRDAYRILVGKPDGKSFCMNIS